MTLAELLEYLDGNGLIIVDLDMIEDVLDDLGYDIEGTVKTESD
jgi:hypothetical protein